MQTKLLFGIVFLSLVVFLSAHGQQNRICPLGSYLGKDAFGNQACLDSHTNQVVSSPNLSQLPSSSTGGADNGTIIGIVVFIIIIAIIAGIAKSRGKSETEKLPRRGWSKIEHDQILDRQGGRCAECGGYSSVFQFDHKDGNPNNDDLSNAQALCPTCHDRKTRGLD